MSVNVRVVHGRVGLQMARVGPAELSVRSIGTLSLVLILLGPGCAWIPRAYVSRVDHAERTRFDIVEGSPMYRLIPRGWITPVDRPSFVAVEDAGFMELDEPVIVFEEGGEARIYSTWFLDGHEVVNDRVADRLVAITWCPLVQAGVVFDRTVDGRALRLQASGRLWRDALVMYDRQTRSHWTQHGGRALLGPAAGANARLEQLPSIRTTWAAAAERWPDARVLRKREDLLGGGQATLYDDYLERTEQLGIFGTHLDDETLPGKTLVLAFERPEGAYALSIPGLARAGGAAMSVGGDPVFAHVVPGGADGRVWRRVARARERLWNLELSPDGEQLSDPSVGARWDALSGRLLAGEADDLQAVATHAVYWFAWQQNHPDTRLWAGEVVRQVPSGGG